MYKDVRTSSWIIWIIQMVKKRSHLTNALDLFVPRPMPPMYTALITCYWKTISSWQNIWQVLSRHNCHWPLFWHRSGWWRCLDCEIYRTKLLNSFPERRAQDEPFFSLGETKINIANCRRKEGERRKGGWLSQLQVHLLRYLSIIY